MNDECISEWPFEQQLSICCVEQHRALMKGMQDVPKLYDLHDIKLGSY
jgi:hypothetical protein